MLHICDIYCTITLLYRNIILRYFSWEFLSLYTSTQLYLFDHLSYSYLEWKALFYYYYELSVILTYFASHFALKQACFVK